MRQLLRILSNRNGIMSLYNLPVINKLLIKNSLQVPIRVLTRLLDVVSLEKILENL